MLQALDQDETFQQTAPIYVLWGNRYPDDFAWALPDTKLDIVFIKVASRADGEWTGAHGYVQTTAVNVIKDFSGVSVYACGSAQMIADAKDALMANGLEENCFYSDAFVSSAKN
jgi:CDP-4-dehydro-6-deoxyglucose reductase